MISEDILQTHKEFKDRKKRLETKRSYDDRENQKLNEIQDIENKIEKLKAKKEEKSKEYNEIQIEKLENLSMIYNDNKLLKEIVNYAEHTTYSHTNLEDIKDLCKHGINEDEINLEILDKIFFAEERINKEIHHTNCFSDFLNNFGECIEFPGEEEE